MRFTHREATNWRHVHSYLIKPWEEQADTYPTERLYDLVTDLIVVGAMNVAEDDFRVSGWYDVDFSCEIRIMMETLGNLSGLLLVRDGVDEYMLSDLESDIADAQAIDVIDAYIQAILHHP